MIAQKLVQTQFASTGNRADPVKAFVEDLRARAGVEIDEARLNDVPLPSRTVE